MNFKFYEEKHFNLICEIRKELHSLFWLAKYRKHLLFKFNDTVTLFNESTPIATLSVYFKT